MTMGYDDRSGNVMPNPASLGDMVRRGRTMLEKDRDDSTKYSARVQAGMKPNGDSRKDTVDFLRKPVE